MKKWYAIRKQGDSRWLLYEIPKSHLSHLKRGYEYCGPFNSIAEAIIKTNEKPEIIKT